MSRAQVPRSGGLVGDALEAGRWRASVRAHCVTVTPGWAFNLWRWSVERVVIDVTRARSVECDLAFIQVSTESTTAFSAGSSRTAHAQSESPISRTVTLLRYGSSAIAATERPQPLTDRAPGRHHRSHPDDVALASERHSQRMAREQKAATPNGRRLRQLTSWASWAWRRLVST